MPTRTTRSARCSNGIAAPRACAASGVSFQPTTTVPVTADGGDPGAIKIGRPLSINSNSIRLSGMRSRECCLPEHHQIVVARMEDQARLQRISLFRPLCRDRAVCDRAGAKRNVMGLTETCEMRTSGRRQLVLLLLNASENVIHYRRGA